MTQAMRNAIDAGLRAFCSETGDFDMSSAMRRSAVDHIMGQPGMFVSDRAGIPMINKIVRAMLSDQSAEALFERGDNKGGWQSLARAALTAMLEPTPAMIRSVDDDDSDPMVARGRAYSAFVTMIQAALDETGE